LAENLVDIEDQSEIMKAVIDKDIIVGATASSKFFPIRKTIVIVDLLIYNRYMIWMMMIFPCEK
jgi:hypothetical protein